MTENGLIQIGIYLAVLMALVYPVGSYIAGVYQREGQGRIEGIICRLCCINPAEEMTWQKYTSSAIWFSLTGFVSLYLLQLFQSYLPLNPQNMPAVSAHSAFNTAVSFVTNTNWQGYGGEATMSYLTQMAGLGVQNFLSAATGMAVLAALIRGISRVSAGTIGNFWVDITRTTLYILLPLSFVLALALVSQGVVQSLEPYQKVTMLQAIHIDSPLSGNKNETLIKEQLLPLGPAASQIAIKQLGTNGGGFFNTNSAHPFENPNALSNLLQMFAILLIPAALCIAFGRMIGDKRQGWALLAAMMIIFLPMLLLCYHLEQQENPYLSSIGVGQVIGAGGNMEGKEVRFGIANSALWAAATTSASNGSVNSMHDSFSALGGLIPMILIQLGEIVFGGVGSGLYGMIMFVFVTVFAAGLMVGRTPEYLGKKIEAFEMKMASLAVLIPASLVLIGTAAAVLTKSGISGIANPGPHGFSEILYAFSSAANNNGSAFAGLSADTFFYNILLGIAMLLGRFGVMIPVLAAAGSLAVKKRTPAGPGTLPTHTPLFVSMLVMVIILVGALTFFPALALGPIAEYVISK